MTTEKTSKHEQWLLLKKQVHYDYMNSNKSLKSLSQNYEIPYPTLTGWKQREKWERDPKYGKKSGENKAPRNNKGKAGAPKGDQNGKGHGPPKGSRNALMHGLHTKFLRKDQIELVEIFGELDNREKLKFQINNLMALMYENSGKAAENVYEFEKFATAISKISDSLVRTIAQDEEYDVKDLKIRKLEAETVRAEREAGTSDVEDEDMYRSPADVIEDSLKNISQTNIQKVDDEDDE